MQYPILILALFWLGGILIGSIRYFLGFPIALSIIGGLILLWFSLRKYSKNSLWWISLLLLSVMLFGFSKMAWYIDAHESEITKLLTQKPLASLDELGIKGYVSSKPEYNGEVIKFTVKPIAILFEDKEYPLHGQEDILTYLIVKEEQTGSQDRLLKQGMGITAYGKLSKPTTFRNKGSFDYVKYLERNLIYWKFTINDATKVQTSSGRQFLTLLQDIKDIWIDGIDQSFPPRESGFMKAILLGERGYLFKELEDSFSLLGLSHLLAISGLHLSVFTMFFVYVLTSLEITKERVFIITGLFLILYMFFAGGSPSVIRATIMTVLMLYGLLYGKRINSLQLLGIAFILMTFYNPNWIYDIGFQLSFTITFFILFGYNRVFAKIPIKNNLLRSSISLLIITQISSFPLVFYYFHQYSFIAIIANFIIVPFFSFLILPLGFIILFLLPFHLVATKLLALLITMILTKLFWFLNWLSSISFLNVYGSINSFIYIIVIYMGILWFFLRGEIKKAYIAIKIKRMLFRSERIILLLIFGIVMVTMFLDNGGAITVIDVGQGDSILIETAKKHHVLIDSGGIVSYHDKQAENQLDYFDVGEDVVLPFLHSQGISQLDFAILTHEDYDHIGGYFTLLDKMKIEAFIVGKEFPRTELGNRLLEKLQSNHVKLVMIDTPMKLMLDETTSLHLIPVDVQNSNKENDHSLITLMKMYDTYTLFAADMEKEGEKSFLSYKQLENIDIIKIGHHGSDTSTSKLFINKIKPNDAIISVGQNNRYKHPSIEVLHRLNDFHIRVWRTDKDGAIYVHIKKNGYRIETYN